MEIAIIVLLAVVIVLQLLILMKKQKSNGKEIIEKIENESRTIRENSMASTNALGQSIYQGLNTANSLIMDNVKSIADNSAERIREMKNETAIALKDMRYDINNNLKEVREDNTRQLDKMREVVDEKLTTTLNERLTQSFGLISTNLENVMKGFGEMKVLAGDVNDLTRVLSNVKSRGVWGEVSLENILSDILTDEQYIRSANVTGTQERVDFAVILPGKEDSVLLPIDVKFPIEDFQRLSDERVDGGETESQALLRFRNTVKKLAKSISDKYINPPFTTNFAIMYLPTEGLYAEVLRLPGLVEELQTNYKVVPSGPTNISAMLNMLRVGFNTLAIQKYSGEIYKMLGVFKKEFRTFNELFVKAQTQLDRAKESLSSAQKKTERIDKQLSKIEKIYIPEGEDDAPELIS